MISLEEELDDYAAANETLLGAFRGRTFFISGAAGLIGSYLVKLLAAANRRYALNLNVVACDRDSIRLDKMFGGHANSGLRMVSFDICSPPLPPDTDAARIDYIVHAASNTSPLDYAAHPIDTIWTNVCGARNLMDFALRTRARRFLFCSSVEVYGRAAAGVDAFTEDASGYVDCNTVRAGYPSAKRCVEALCNAYAREHASFEFVTARIGRCFGPTMIADDAKAHSQFIRNAVQREDIVLKSAGTQRYSYIYVGDCVTALLELLANGRAGEAYNVAHPEPHTLRRLAEFAAQTAGTRVRTTAQSGEERKAYSTVDMGILDVGKLLGLGWRPRFSVRDGMERTIQFLEKAQ